MTEPVTTADMRGEPADFQLESDWFEEVRAGELRQLSLDILATWLGHWRTRADRIQRHLEVAGVSNATLDPAVIGGCGEGWMSTFDPQAWRDLDELKRRMQDDDDGLNSSNSFNSYAEKPWPWIDGEAYHGLVGDIIETIEPHSEADPIAILVQLLAAAGNIIGRNCYFQIESDRHHANLFAVLVGPSGKARKGTSWGRVYVTRQVDPKWEDERVRSGLSSGEGFINEVRDEVRRWEPKDRVYQVVDPGADDKRLMVIEPEFASLLSVMERPGNTLSPVLRKAWDGTKLETMTRASPLKATDGHVSIIGHITEMTS